MKKLSGINSVEFEFIVKYKNGVIAKTSNIDDLLSEENHGSKSIVKIEMIAFDSGDRSRKIGISFSKLIKNSDQDGKSIVYEILSDDKDWMFVTSSVLEERINKICSHILIDFLINKKIGFFLPLISVIVLLYYSYIEINISNDRMERIKSLKITSIDIWDYVYNIDLMNAENSGYIVYFPIVFLMAYIIPIVCYFSFFYFVRWYPLYHFYWGDAKDIYDKKTKLVNYILYSVVFVVIIGVFINYLSDKFF